MRLLKTRDMLGKANLALRVIVIAWISQLSISRAAWAPGERGFPRAQVIPGIDPAWMEIPGLLAVGLGAVVILWKPGKNLGQILLLGGMALLVLMDVNRLQPWAFVYAVIGLGMAAAGQIGKSEKEGNHSPTGSEKLRIVRMVIGCVWFWSGAMKLNPAFAGDFFPGLMEPFGLGEWALNHPEAAFLAGGMEAMAGVLFLIPRLRKYGLVTGLAVHGFILAALGPFGLNWNAVVWPWNIAFMALAILSVAPGNANQPACYPKTQLLPTFGVILLVGLLPLLNLFGQWDHFLSHSFYSGRVPTATFYFHPDDRFLVPASARPYVLQVEGGDEFLIPLELWALGELKIPGYPEIRTRKNTATTLCKCLNRPEKAGLRIVEQRGFSSRTISDTADCASLLRYPFSKQLTIQ
jgi:uncharacterized membrane protein YphA (DoxX/SURF4 family)